MYWSLHFTVLEPVISNYITMLCLGNIGYCHSTQLHTWVVGAGNCNTATKFSIIASVYWSLHFSLSSLTTLPCFLWSLPALIISCMYTAHNYMPLKCCCIILIATQSLVFLPTCIYLRCMCVYTLYIVSFMTLWLYACVGVPTPQSCDCSIHAYIHTCCIYMHVHS